MPFIFTKRFLVLLSLLLFASLFLLIYLYFKQNKISQEAGDLVTHTYQVINRSERLQYLVAQEVMEARGFLLTGESSYLLPLKESREEIDSINATLTELIEDNPVQQEQLARIKSWIHQRQAFTDSIHKISQGDRMLAIALVRSGKGKLIMDSLNRNLNEFFLQEFQLLHNRKQAVEHSKKMLDLTQVIFLFIVTLISSTFVFIFFRFIMAQLSFMKEAKYKSTVLENISEAVVLTDTNFIITAWNKKAQLQYGWNQKEALGRKLADVVGLKPSYYRSATLQQLLRFGKWQGEVEHINKAGEPMTVLASLTMLRSVQGEYIGSVSIFRDITERKKMEESLQQTNQSLEDMLEKQLLETQAANLQLRELNKGLKEAREDERRKISRELHDDLGQVLTSARIHMSLLLEEIDIRDRELKKRFEELIKTLDRSIQWVRNLAMELRPLSLEDLGLFQAIQMHAEKFSKEVKIPVEIYNDVEELIIDNEKGTHIFRIFQEALNNVAKHSKATLVNIRITMEDSQFVMTITDNGQGFDHSKAHKRSLGLTTIKERSKILNALYSIQSFPGKGTEVKLLMPLFED